MFSLSTVQGTFDISTNTASTNKSSLQFSCSGSYPICKKCLEDSVTETFKDDSLYSSTETLLEDLRIEWDQLCAEIETLRLTPAPEINLNNPCYIGLCSLPIEPKKVNLQPLPSPPPAAPLPDSRDSSSGPQVSPANGTLVNTMADGKQPDIAL